MAFTRRKPMMLVETLLVRDEADIVGTQIAYHLEAGVDFVIAADHASVDGTAEILESFVREGYLRRIPVEGPMQDGPWRTHMAQLAATEHGADWILNTDADEFWMPHRGSLKETFSAIPEPYGVVSAVSRHFVPRPDHGEPFYERMTARVSAPAAINDPASPYRPHVKAAHRADPEITVSFGSHTVGTERWRAVANWHPADVLHFPFRSLGQWENKGRRRARGDKPLGQYVAVLQASEKGRGADRFRTLVVDDAALARGVADGSLVIDSRLRDVLRRLGGKEIDADPVATAAGAPVPGVDLLALDAGEVQDAAAVRDAELVRLQRRVDRVLARAALLEARSARP